MTDINVDIHADDYALTVNTSAEMLELMRDGVLDRISIIPNMSCYDICIDMLKREIPNLPFLPKMSVHLNLVEGLWLSAEVENLSKNPLSADGLSAQSWGGLFLGSFIPFKAKATKDALKLEIKQQIEKTQKSIEECINLATANNIPCSQKHIRIDSHPHTHMIPVVWEALSECIEENGYKCEYIRNSKEPLWPFISKISLWHTYRPVNIIKNRILHLLSFKADRYGKNHNIPSMYLWGLVMSGKIDSERIKTLYSKIHSMSLRDRRSLEILFHP